MDLAVSPSSFSVFKGSVSTWSGVSWTFSKASIGSRATTGVSSSFSSGMYNFSLGVSSVCFL